MNPIKGLLANLDLTPWLDLATRAVTAVEAMAESLDSIAHDVRGIAAEQGVLPRGY